MNAPHARLWFGLAAAAAFLWAALAFGRTAEPEGVWRIMNEDIERWLASQSGDPPAADSRLGAAASSAGPQAAEPQSIEPQAADPQNAGPEAADAPSAAPAPAEPRASESSSPEPSGLVDINRATPEELDALPGIGPAKARAIVAYREAHGTFRNVEELLNVSGIGEATLAKLRPFVRASEPGR